MKRNSKVFGMLAAGILSATLLAGPALAADPEIRVGSYKGNTLEAGERSCLIIGPAGPEYTAESSNPEAITLERVLTYWVAVAKAEGTAEITVTNADGTAGSLTLTVGTAEAADDFQKETSALAQADTLDLSASLDIRLEMVRLINEVRREALQAIRRRIQSQMNGLDVSAAKVSGRIHVLERFLARFRKAG